MNQQHTLTYIDTGPDHSITPDVPKGGMRGFIIGRKAPSGAIVTMHAWYLNEYLLDYGGEQCPQCPLLDKNCADENGSCPQEEMDGCPTTGWYFDESNFDHEHCYYQIDGTVLAFAKIPQYAPPITPDADAHEGGAE